MPITDHELIKYLCNQCKDEDLQDVLKNELHKDWVVG